MGIQHTCSVCGTVIGVNPHYGHGMCQSCAALSALDEQYKQICMEAYRRNPQWQEKEIFGETIREVPLIGSDEEVTK